MNDKKRNLRSNNEAVSHVIGVVLMTAVFVTMLTMFQASVVPLWNKQVEADHIPAVYDDMTGLSSDIADSASRAIAKKSSIQLGARYPNRMIFRNPGPGAFGTLTVENDVAVNVVCRDVDGVEIASQNYKTSRLIYDLTGTVNSPKLVYEHGIIIREWDDGTVLGPIPPENHTLYDDHSANVYIPIVNGSSTSASSLDSKLVSIFPFTSSQTVDDIANLTITLDTDYPGVWDDILRSTDNVTASVSGNEIKINSTEIEKIFLPVIDDVISSDLYTGMITGSATLEGGLWVSGEGTDIMAIGSRVANVPSSTAATAIVVQDMVVDADAVADLKSDFITITVTDNNWNWWKVIMDLNYDPSGGGKKEITSIKVKSNNGISNYLATNFEFTQLTVIDLFDPDNFDTDKTGLYQNASIGNTNRLVTNIADDTNQKTLAMISFRLLYDDD